MKNAKQAVEFTKLKQFYLPVSADDYKMLRAHGIPMIRIHENMMPTIGLLLKKHKIKASVKPFVDEILDPYLERLGTQWHAKEHRKATINKTWMRFETTHASIQPQGREALRKVEESLRRFFTRWGYAASFELSESRGKLKLHVQYRFDAERSPVIHLTEDHTVVPPIKLDFGFIRLQLVMLEKELEVSVLIATGTDWTSIHTGRCLYSQVTDVRQMISGLVNIVDRDPHNADNKAK